MRSTMNSECMEKQCIKNISILQLEEKEIMKDRQRIFGDKNQEDEVSWMSNM